MAERLDQIAAAIPVRALALVRLDDTRREEQRVPGAHQHAIVQRPAQLRRRRSVADRRKRREIGTDRQDVVADQFRERGVREGRIIVRPAWRDPHPQRAEEIVLAPAADPGIVVGCEVWRKHRTERRVDPLAAGERLCRIGGVAACAVAGDRERLAAGNDVIGWRSGAFAGRERTAQQRCDQNRTGRSMSSPHPFTFRIFRSTRRVTPFRRGPVLRQKPKRRCDIPGTILRFSGDGVGRPELCCAGRKIRHRLVLTSSDD